jgi:hypothetical protein
MTACTEKEAAEKWCPHFRGNSAQTGDVAVSKGNEEGRCIGSCCMQWRWDGPAVEAYKWKPAGEGWQKDGEFWKRAVPPDERRGYCGLAGKP